MRLEMPNHIFRPSFIAAALDRALSLLVLAHQLE